MPDSLLAIFSAPKPFRDEHIITIQRNAIRSWKALGDQVDVLLLGDEEGIGRHAADLGTLHVEGVRCNQQGTPLISSMLQLARKASHAPFLMIVNADILLFPDILAGLQNVSQAMPCFLIIGQRWDVDIREELHLDSGQVDKLKLKILQTGRLHAPMGSDYFIFPRACYMDIPELAIGRGGWDNWFIYKSRWESCPVVDATRDITVAHQQHDYHHLPGGQPHYRLPETHENVRLGGGEHTIFTIFDAQFSLENGRIHQRKLTGKKIFREMEILPLTRLRSHALGKAVFYLLRPKKAYWQLRKTFKKYLR